MSVGRRALWDLHGEQERARGALHGQADSLSGQRSCPHTATKKPPALGGAQERATHERAAKRTSLAQRPTAAAWRWGVTLSSTRTLWLIVPAGQREFQSGMASRHVVPLGSTR